MQRCQHAPRAVRKPAGLDVHDRRLNPLDEGGIRSPEQAQRFANVPAVEVDVVGDRILDDVALFFQVNRQIPVGLTDVDKAHVEVAVGRGETPRTAARLDRQDDAHALLLLGAGKATHDFSAHFRSNHGIYVNTVASSCLPSNVRSTAGFALAHPSAAIARMACGKTLIAVLVIPGDARHQLLSVRVARLRYFREELLSSRAAQRGGKRPMV